MITIVESNEDIFTVPVEAIVIPINCVGTMSNGLAAQVKKLYPECSEYYKKMCMCGTILIGTVLVYKIPEHQRNHHFMYILNLPTKGHWNAASKYEFIKKGLRALDKCVCSLGIESIAIPALGCGCGGLDRSTVRELVYQYFLSPPSKYLRTCYLLQF